MRVALGTLLLAALACAAPAFLPGYTGPNVHLRTGYVTGATPTQHIFYVHVSLTATPRRVALWFQGGPGGSSMIGLFEEMGPFHVLSNNSVAYRAQVKPPKSKQAMRTRARLTARLRIG